MPESGVAAARPEPVRIAVLGANGFIGRHVVAEACRRGAVVTCLPGVRLPAACGPAWSEARRWERSYPAAHRRLVEGMGDAHAVVNAAGLAAPGRSDLGPLMAANAVLPAVVASAAREAGVARLVHVSSAVVQGRLDPLDESELLLPASPYARSKAEGERSLLEGHAVPPEVVVYRATSVQHPSRPTTRRLARLHRLPVMPVVDTTRPVPLALVENVAAGIVFAATMAEPHAVVLQPYEGVTTGRVLDLFGPDRTLTVPGWAARAGREVMARACAPVPQLTSAARRIEVLVLGQGVAAKRLASSGFAPPVGPEGWDALARQLKEWG